MISTPPNPRIGFHSSKVIQPLDKWIQWAFFKSGALPYNHQQSTNLKDMNEPLICIFQGKGKIVEGRTLEAQTNCLLFYSLIRMVVKLLQTWHHFSSYIIRSTKWVICFLSLAEEIAFSRQASCNHAAIAQVVLHTVIQKHKVIQHEFMV